MQVEITRAFRYTCAVVQIVLLSSAAAQNIEFDYNEWGEIECATYLGESEWIEEQRDERSRLHTFPKLESVRLNNHLVSRSELEYISRLDRVKYLEIGWAPEGVALDRGALSVLSKASRLEGLSICKLGLCDEDIAALQSLVNLKYLKLDMAGVPLKGDCSLTDRSATSLAKLVSLHNLEIGSVHAKLTNDFVKGLVTLPNLQELRIGSTFPFTDELFSLVAGLPLRTLDVSSPLFSDEGVRALSRMKTLEEVHIGNSSLTNRSVRVLAQLPQLRILGLALENVDNDALGAIAANKNLEELYLREASPSDEVLSQLKGHPALRMLFVDGKNLTDESRRIFSTLRKLERVDLGESGP